MDPRAFDSLTRSLATATTRRGLLGGLAALAAGVRAATAAQSCPPGQSPNRKGDCSCPAGIDPCPDGCYDLDRDPNHCGRCDRTCLGGTCVKGQCRCPVGTVLCAGVCRSQASFATDSNHCGGCGRSCDDGNVCTMDSCAGGVCQHEPIDCNDFNDCTSDSCAPEVGCVHTLLTGTDCTSEGGAAGTCADGACVENTTTTTTTAAPGPTTTTTTTTTAPQALGLCVGIATGAACNTGGVCLDERCFLAFPNCHSPFAVAANSGGAHACVCDFVDKGDACETTSDCPAGRWCVIEIDGGVTSSHCYIGCLA